MFWNLITDEQQLRLQSRSASATTAAARSFCKNNFYPNYFWKILSTKAVHPVTEKETLDCLVFQRVCTVPYFTTAKTTFNQENGSFTSATLHFVWFCCRTSDPSDDGTCAAKSTCVARKTWRKSPKNPAKNWKRQDGGRGRNNKKNIPPPRLVPATPFHVIAMMNMSPPLYKNCQLSGLSSAGTFHFLAHRSLCTHSVANE